MMALSDEPITDIDQLPVLLTAEELAALLRCSQRSIRRMHQLKLLPASRGRTWARYEIIAWILAGRPSHEVWERIRP